VFFGDSFAVRMACVVMAFNEKGYLQCILVAIIVHAVRKPNQIQRGVRASDS
jgi:hypothetical protein